MVKRHHSGCFALPIIARSTHSPTFQTVSPRTPVNKGVFKGRSCSTEGHLLPFARMPLSLGHLAPDQSHERVRRAGSRGSSLPARDLAPAPGPVMRNDGPKHGEERLLVDRLPPIDGHGPCRLVFVTRGDDALRIGTTGS